MPREIDLRSKIENVRIITPLLLGPYGIKLFVKRVKSLRVTIATFIISSLSSFNICCKYDKRSQAVFYRLKRLNEFMMHGSRKKYSTDQ